MYVVLLGVGGILVSFIARSSVASLSLSLSLSLLGVVVSGSRCAFACCQWFPVWLPLTSRCVCVCESNSACSGGNNDNDGGCGVAVVEGKMRTESLHSLFSNQPLVPAFETFEGPDRYCYISVWLPVVKAFAPRTLSGPSPA